MVPLEPVCLLLEHLSLASLTVMKRFGRILGILGAIGAIIWAMRDRFVSLTVPREPEPPSFRPAPPGSETPSARPPVAEPQSSPRSDAEPDDLTAVNGIGPVFAQRLSEAGITTFGQLAATDNDRLREVLGSRLGNVEAILEDARRLAGA